MEVVIKGIKTGLKSEILRQLEERGIRIIYRGSNIDLEIEDNKLSMKILKEEFGIAFN